MELKSVISERLKQLRKSKNLTQSELGSLVNVSPQVISNWERAYTPTIDADDILRLSKALDTSVEYLVTGNEDRSISTAPPNEQKEPSAQHRNLEVEQLAPEKQTAPEYIELHRLIKNMPKEEVKQILSFAKYVNNNLKGKDRKPDDDDDF